MKKVLVIAAHPDDEVLGCGATIAKMAKKGHEIYTLILGEGKTARSEYKPEDLEVLDREIKEANEILGVKEIFVEKFPDNRFDSVDILDIIKKIEEYKFKIMPDIVFTHHFGDINIDHQVTYKALLTATRPIKSEIISEIYSFEIPSSTEWGSFSRNDGFIPNIFEDVTETIDLKVKAMACYKSELRDYPHPRSLEHIKNMARVNGAKVGFEYCENFTLIRSLRV